MASVSKNSNPVTVKDSVTGKDNLAENFYYITIVQNGTPDTEDVKKASLAAGEFVYNIFDQITTGKIPSDVTILIDTSKGDVTLDVSRCEWAPCNTFTGYFGTTDPNHKVIIDGARLTKQTGYANTVVFEGSEAKAADGTRRSKYFITGFFGVVYGKTTIENVTFKNLSIAEPGKDFQIAINNTSRNTVGVIGGICDGNGSNIANEKVDVKLNNIIVESSCSVKGAASVGGLVGYVGRSGGSNEISGNISITNCHVKCDVTSTNEPNPNGYHPIGGMIGYVVSTSAATRHNKNGGLNITLDNCSYSGTLTGNNSVGAVLGDNTDWATGTLTIKGGDYSGAKFASTNNARNSRNAALVRYTCGSADIGTFIKTEGDIKFNTEFPAFITSSGKYDFNKNKLN